MMFFRRLQLPQNDGLSARPGAKVDRAPLPWSDGANPIADRASSQPWKSRHTSQPWRVPFGVVDLWRFALAAPQPGTRLRLHALQPVSSAVSPSVQRTVTPSGCSDRGHSHQRQRTPMSALQPATVAD